MTTSFPIFVGLTCGVGFLLNALAVQWVQGSSGHGGGGHGRNSEAFGSNIPRTRHAFKVNPNKTYFFPWANSGVFYDVDCWLLIYIVFWGRSMFSCFFWVFFLCWMRICCLSLCFKTGKIQQDGMWLLKESGERRSIARKPMGGIKQCKSMVVLKDSPHKLVHCLEPGVQKKTSCQFHSFSHSLTGFCPGSYDWWLGSWFIGTDFFHRSEVGEFSGGILRRGKGPVGMTAQLGGYGMSVCVFFSY